MSRDGSSTLRCPDTKLRQVMPERVTIATHGGSEILIFKKNATD